MQKISFIFIFIFLLIIPFCFALELTATVNIFNSPVKIELITTGLENNVLTVKAKVSDANGYEDIEKVEVKVMFGEEVYSDYQEAVLDSSSGSEALYVYNLVMNSEDKEGIYTVKVKASDQETEIERESSFDFPEEQGLITGAFIRGPDDGPGLLTRFFGWLRGLFS